MGNRQVRVLTDALRNRRAAGVVEPERNERPEIPETQTVSAAEVSVEEAEVVPAHSSRQLSSSSETNGEALEKRQSSSAEGNEHNREAQQFSESAQKRQSSTESEPKRQSSTESDQIRQSTRKESEQSPGLCQQLLAEHLGTFVLTFTLLSLMVAHQGPAHLRRTESAREAPTEKPWGCFIMGLCFMVLAYMCGNLGKTHFNPAVTVSVFATEALSQQDGGQTFWEQMKDAPVMEVGLCVLVQLLGANFAGCLAFYLFWSVNPRTRFSGEHIEYLGHPPQSEFRDDVSFWRVAFREFLGVFFFVYVFLHVSIVASGISRSSSSSSDWRAAQLLAVGFQFFALLYLCVSASSRAFLNPALVSGTHMFESNHAQVDAGLLALLPVQIFAGILAAAFCAGGLMGPSLFTVWKEGIHPERNDVLDGGDGSSAGQRIDDFSSSSDMSRRRSSRNIEVIPLRVQFSRIVVRCELPRYLAEFMGTLNVCLIACATPPGAGRACAVAATGVAHFYATGRLSGGHFNPALTLAAVVRGGNENKVDFLYYSAVQLVGGLWGASFGVMLGGGADESVSQRSVGKDHSVFEEEMQLHWVVILGTEFFFTFLLCTVFVFATTVSWRGNTAGPTGRVLAGLSIGACVLVGAFAAGPFSGAPLNPAVVAAVYFRDVMGPAEWRLEYVFAYWAAELAAGVLAGLVPRALGLPAASMDSLSGADVAHDSALESDASATEMEEDSEFEWARGDTVMGRRRGRPHPEGGTKQALQTRSERNSKEDAGVGEVAGSRGVGATRRTDEATGGTGSGGTGSPGTTAVLGAAARPSRDGGRKSDEDLNLLDDASADADDFVRGGQRRPQGRSNSILPPEIDIESRSSDIEIDTADFVAAHVARSVTKGIEKCD